MHAVFLDRDGVICENRPDHVKSWAEFEFLPGVKESMPVFSRMGLPIIIVTNQSAVSHGLASASTVEEIHRRMVDQLTAWGGRIDRVIYCPHRPQEACSCRKPNPGMLEQAAREMGLDLTESYMVGDAATDIMAGQRVGCRSFLVLTGRGVPQLSPAFRNAKYPFSITHNLLGAANQILAAELQRASAVNLWELHPHHYRQPLPVAVR